AFIWTRLRTVPPVIMFCDSLVIVDMKARMSSFLAASTRPLNASSGVLPPPPPPQPARANRQPATSELLALRGMDVPSCTRFSAAGRVLKTSPQAGLRACGGLLPAPQLLFHQCDEVDAPDAVFLGEMQVVRLAFGDHLAGRLVAGDLHIGDFRAL